MGRVCLGSAIRVPDRQLPS